MWRGRGKRRYSITHECGAKLPRCVIRVPREAFFFTHVFTSGAEVWSVAFKDTQYINYTWAQKAAVTELMYKCAYLHVSPPNRAATRRAAS